VQKVPADGQAHQHCRVYGTFCVVLLFALNLPGWACALVEFVQREQQAGFL
jgi:hypothetical protein